MSDLILTIVILVCVFFCIGLTIFAFVYYKQKQYDEYIIALTENVPINSQNHLFPKDVFRHAEHATVLHRYIAEQDKSASQEDSPLEIKPFDIRLFKSQEKIISALNSLDNSVIENNSNGSSANSPQKEPNVSDKVH